jgi:SAM-dependent methyltransferase
MINKYIKPGSSILIFGGGQMEKEVFKDSKYNITFLNIGEADLKSVKHEIIIASMHNNKIENETYDYVLANATIHHASKPHNSVLEMYRIAKKGILIIEGNDSLLMKISTKFGLSEIYEYSAIQNFQGGVDNSSIPNYIYRWTEREIHKLLNSYKPEVIHKIIFDYEFDLGNIFKNNVYKKKTINCILWIFFLIFRKQKNLISIYVDKINLKSRIS